MNAITQSTTKLPTAAEIEQRLRDERSRQLIEQNLQAELDAQRLAPLEAGDDEALDRIEAQIGQSQDRQCRIIERIEILEKRLAAALANDQAAHLDAIAERADRAREAGERLIRTEYVKAARALATILDRLLTGDALIEQVNSELEAAGRPRIPSPNAIRERPMTSVDWTEHKAVPVTDPNHPMHGRVGFGHGKQTAHDLITKQPVDWFADVDIEHHDVVGAEWRLPLYQAIELPTIEPEPVNHRQLPHVTPPLPIWKATDNLRDVEPEKVETLIAELDTANTRTKK